MTSPHPDLRWSPPANEVGVPAFVPGITLTDTGSSPGPTPRFLAAIPYLLVFAGGICIPVETRGVSDGAFDADTIGPRASSGDAFRLAINWSTQYENFTPIPVRGRSVANMKRDVSATLFSAVPSSSNRLLIQVAWPHVGVDQPVVHSVDIDEIHAAQRRAFRLLGSEIDPETGLTIASRHQQ